MIINKVYLDFFKLLQKYKINYILLERHEFLSKDIKGDVDIFVEDIYKFEQFLKKNKISIIQKFIHHYKGINYFIFYKNTLLNLDLYQEYIISHKVIFDKDFFIKNIGKKENIYFLDYHPYLKYYLIKKIIKEDLPTKKLLFINHIEEIDLNDKLSDKNINLLKKYIKNQHIKIPEKKFIKILKKDILNHSKLNINSIFFEIKRVSFRLIKPPGLTISILGPDGSGKSTIINLLKKEKLPFRRIHCFHLKPRIFGNKGDGKPVTNPHGKEPHRGLKSYLKLIYFALDYIIGYWIKIFPLTIRSSLIIFDRYYDDILVDPKRYRYSGSIKFAKVLKILIPEPDIYIILTTEPHIIYKRKVEVSFEELKRQIQEYDNLLDNKKFFKIDASLPPKQILDKINEIIIKKLAKRYESK